MRQSAFKQRLAKVIVDDNGCWLWRSRMGANGYGIEKSHLTGKHTTAHRAIYEYFVGPIPDGLELDHLCRVRHCVNPSHMEPVTHAENNRRGESVTAINAAKTECIRGHSFNEANTYVNPGSGSRGCRICRRDGDRQARIRRAAGVSTTQEGN